jgi:phenylacetate-CoA ligase
VLFRSALKAFPEAGRFQAVITRSEQQDHLAVVIESTSAGIADAGLPARIAEALREAIKVRGEVQLVAPGTLPQGGKRMDDRRVWR